MFFFANNKWLYNGPFFETCETFTFYYNLKTIKNRNKFYTFCFQEIQDLIVFFGADKAGNVILLCINQAYNFKQSNSFIFVQDHTGLQFTNKGILCKNNNAWVRLCMQNEIQIICILLNVKWYCFFMELF